MASDDNDPHTCPYCREQVQPEAIKCKHCGSTLEPDRPAHGGTCPYCKEQIHPEAIKCKHCKSELTASRAGRENDCGCTGTRDVVRPVMMSRLIGGGGPAPTFGGGGMFGYIDHQSWQDCVDAYADCRTAGSRSRADCSAAFARCQGRP